jgi:type IX secretion system PorP/SprF family membrane protein
MTHPKSYFLLTGVLSLGLFAGGLRATAQQIPNFSLYGQNHFLVNPAATGTSERVPLAASFRKLWAGLERSPSVQYVSGHMQVYDNMGAGARLFNYTAGPLRKTGLEAAYSYHLSLGNNDSKLAFGLSLQLYQFYLNKADMTVEDDADEVFQGRESMFVPDAGFGMYYYADNYFVGLSVPQLFQRNIDLKSDIILQQKQVRHYYLHGGYTFEITPDINLEPSVLLKFVEAGIFQADINALATYKKMVKFGISYRSSDALVFQAGYMTGDLFIGYAYDLILSGLRTNTWGSHEVMVGWTMDNFIRR